MLTTFEKRLALIESRIFKFQRYNGKGLFKLKQCECMYDTDDGCGLLLKFLRHNFYVRSVTF